MSSCFKGNDKFLPNFLKESLHSMLQYICDDNEKNLKGAVISLFLKKKI